MREWDAMLEAEKTFRRLKAHKQLSNSEGRVAAVPVHRNAIRASRQCLTLRQTFRSTAIELLIALVQPSELVACFGVAGTRADRLFRLVDLARHTSFEANCSATVVAPA